MNTLYPEGILDLLSSQIGPEFRSPLTPPPPPCRSLRLGLGHLCIIFLENSALYLSRHISIRVLFVLGGLWFKKATQVAHPRSMPRNMPAKHTPEIASRVAHDAAKHTPEACPRNIP